jgi:hypothetical protein
MHARLIPGLRDGFTTAVIQDDELALVREAQAAIKRDKFC